MNGTTTHPVLTTSLTRWEVGVGEAIRNPAGPGIQCPDGQTDGRTDGRTVKKKQQRNVGFTQGARRDDGWGTEERNGKEGGGRGGSLD